MTITHNLPEFVLCFTGHGSQPSCPSRVTALQKNSCLDEGWISDTPDGKRELDNIHMLSEVNQLDNPSKNLLKCSKCGHQKCTLFFCISVSLSCD